MDISGLITKLRNSLTPSRPRAAKRSIDPGILRREGILSDPADPTCAAKRARSLIGQGRYREALALLQPHSDSSEPVASAKVEEQLATCAIAGAGGDWAAHCSRALDAYALTEDHRGMARVRQLLGEAMLAAGRFSAADAQLQQAAGGFIEAGAPDRAAIVEATRARIPLLAGNLDDAAEALQQSLRALGEHQMSRAEALTRLDLAEVHAAKGDATAATQEVLRAETLLTGRGTVADRVRIGLARAETLLQCGESLRAALGLKHQLNLLREVEEVPLRARLFYLLGKATARSEPEVAQGYFLQSRQLYDRLRQDYWTAWCDIALARLDVRLGQDPGPRLYRLTHHAFTEAPVLQNEVRLLAVQLGACATPDEATRNLLQARQFAVSQGHQDLLDRVEVLLRQPGRVSSEPEASPGDSDVESAEEPDFRAPFFRASPASSTALVRR